MQHQLIDNFGRKHDYLRISLTDACNLRCVYCMPNEKVLVTPNAKLMQVAEIEAIAKTFVELGIRKIRLTGGEPLLRKDARNIIERLSHLPVELSISTNAILVDQYIDTFKAAGIRSVNVSLDTLDANEFFNLTKRGDFDKITANIRLLLEQDFELKVNMVVMKGINESSVLDFIEWTRNTDLEVRFIEFMPFSGNDWNRETVFSYQDMLDLIAQKGYEYERLQDGPNDTTKHYRIPGFKGNFGFITTVTAPFCGTCNRLRLTADGKLKNCLFSTGEIDLLSVHRKGGDLIPLILENLSHKKQERGGLFDDADHIRQNRSMIQIGG